MTLFEFIVPVIALAVAGIGVLVLRREEKSLDKPSARHHPAE